ncbi:MAG: monovalent cation/H(+) antiporter subunit G [Chloroflexi bacterium]|nr:monovalent cation/H(+) antiporter subunit G [Chloroflexota bacterium]
MIGQLLGLLALAIGLGFAMIGILGLLRFPDVYTRIHAAGKVSTLGLVGILAGVALLMPEATPRSIVLILFSVVTLPVASHAIAGAAYKRGERGKGYIRDDLAPLYEAAEEFGWVIGNFALEG